MGAAFCASFRLPYNVALHCIPPYSRSTEETCCEVRTVHIYPCPLNVLKSKSDSWTVDMPSGIYQRLCYGNNDLRPFQDADIGSQFLAKGPRQLGGSCGQRSYILVHADIYHLEISLANADSSMQFPSLLPRGRDNPMTRAYLYMPLGSPSPLKT